MIRDMDKESIYGKMEGSTGENGKMGSNMGLDTFRMRMKGRKGKESGQKGKE
jgi:hypothetical protein